MIKRKELPGFRDGQDEEMFRHLNRLFQYLRIKSTGISTRTLCCF